MRSRIPQPGSIIRLDIGEGLRSYVQYVGSGIHGDALRVFPGTFAEDLSRTALTAASERPGWFIVQTFLRELLKASYSSIVEVLPTQKCEDIAPAWIVSPYFDDVQRQWVAFLDGSESVRMTIYQKDHPEATAATLPETGVLFPGLLREVVASGWTPAVGPYERWIGRKE